MRLSDYKAVCILGRQPALGLAELECLYGSEVIKPLDNAAVLNIEAQDINFSRLGGTVKVGRVLAVLPATGWPEIHKYLMDNIPKHLKTLPEGKFTLGISVYGLSVRTERLSQDMLKIKKLIRQTGRPVRIVPNKELALNSAQVLHNRLTHRGAWELLIIRDSNSTILAQTLFVQDIDAYAARDQARPKRDARIGMLPPKLAQIIVNLAAAQIDKTAASPVKVRVLDPFCGTGVILQEALLMGYSVLGTDIDERMVDYSKQNLRWLFDKYPSLQGHVVLDKGDATNSIWPGFSLVASESYLGRPLNTLPQPAELRQIVSDTNVIIKKFLKNLAEQIKPGRRICLAVPAWQKANGQFVHLPLIDQLTDMGYNRLDLKHAPHGDLVYYRQDQVVGRQLLLLTRTEE